jgi:hypothetical protein
MIGRDVLGAAHSRGRVSVIVPVATRTLWKSSCFNAERTRDLPGILKKIRRCKLEMKGPCVSTNEAGQAHGNVVTESEPV